QSPAIHLDLEADRKTEHHHVGDVDLVNMIFKNKVVWLLFLSNLCMYTVRISILDWILLFAMESRGLTTTGASSCVFWFELFSLAGGFASSYYSDKHCKGNRIPACLYFSAGTALWCVALYSFVSTSYFVNVFIIGMIGFFLNGPHTLLAVAATELVDPRASGTSLGLIGGAVGAAGIAAGMPMGMIIRDQGWNVYVLCLVVTSTMMTVCCFILHTDSEKKEENRSKKKHADRGKGTDQTHHGMAEANRPELFGHPNNQLLTEWESQFDQRVLTVLYESLGRNNTVLVHKDLFGDLNQQQPTQSKRKHSEDANSTGNPVKKQRQGHITLEQLPIEILEHIIRLLLPRAHFRRFSPLFRSLFHLMLCNRNLYNIIHPIYLKHFLSRLSLPFNFPGQVGSYFAKHSETAPLVRTLDLRLHDSERESLEVFKTSKLFPSLRRIKIDIDYDTDRRAVFSSLEKVNLACVKIRMVRMEDGLMESYYDCIEHNLIKPSLEHLELRIIPMKKEGFFFALDRDRTFVQQIEICQNLTKLKLPSYMQSGLTQRTWPLLQRFKLYYETALLIQPTDSDEGYDPSLFSDFYERHPCIKDISLQFTGDVKSNQLPNLERVHCNWQSIEAVISPLSDGTYRPIRSIKVMKDIRQEQKRFSHHLQRLPLLTQLRNVPLSQEGLCHLPPSLEVLGLLAIQSGLIMEQPPLPLPLPPLPKLKELSIKVLDGLESAIEVEDGVCPLAVWLKRWLEGIPTLEHFRIDNKWNVCGEMEVWVDVRGGTVRVTYDDGTSEYVDVHVGSA
ncbi:putative hexose phosphate transport protein, partial [Planoprotostelium fungivorum]